MASPNYNKLVGEGKAGLGKDELKRRVKQHNALAEKAFASVKGKEQLTAADEANIYRGIKLKNDAKLMSTIGDKTYAFPKSNNKKTILGHTKDEWSAAWDATKKGYVDTAKKFGKNISKGYKVLDAINFGLLPGGVKPVNPLGDNAGNTLTRLNSSPNIPVWEDRNKKNKNTKL
jgi:hypothetical protein